MEMSISPVTTNGRIHLEIPRMKSTFNLDQDEDAIFGS